MRINNTEEQLKHLNINDWVVLTPSTGRQMIGIPSLPEEMQEEEYETKDLPKMRKGYVLQCMEEAQVIVLCPVLEFAAEYMGMQGPGGKTLMHKVPMLSGVDFIMDAAVPQYLDNVTRAYFLMDATPEDQREYEKMIRTALDQITGMRAARLGVVPASPGGIVLGSNGR